MRVKRTMRGRLSGLLKCSGMWPERRTWRRSRDVGETTMKHLVICLRAITAISFFLSSPIASAQTFPMLNTTGTGRNNVPVTAFQVPNNIPAADLPTPAGNAVASTAAVQSYAVSQGTPTSPQPNCTEPPTSGQYTLNQYYWPTVAQSISWWESQPGIPAVGTFAYQAGTTQSHQDQEGWAGGCTPDPEPACSTGVGWTGYTWSGQTTGWTGSCTYTPKPACSGTGYVSTYAWSGTAWMGSCTYVAPPFCPAGYTDTYTWSGTAWTGGCTQPPQPSCPAGYWGQYAWGGASGWVNQCYIPPQPSCPAGYGGSYTWNDSAWVYGCTPPAPPPPSICIVTNIEGTTSGANKNTNPSYWAAVTTATLCSNAQNIPLSHQYVGYTQGYGNTYYRVFTYAYSPYGAPSPNFAGYFPTTLPSYTLNEPSFGDLLFCNGAYASSGGITYCPSLEIQLPSNTIVYNGNDTATETVTYWINNGAVSSATSYSNCVAQSRSGSHSVACP